VTDARILGAVVDATILVLRADKSTRKSGEHARNALLAVGARVLGAIVNDAPRRRDTIRTAEVITEIRTEAMAAARRSRHHED